MGVLDKATYDHLTSINETAVINKREYEPVEFVAWFAIAVNIAFVALSVGVVLVK